MSYIEKLRVWNVNAYVAEAVNDLHIICVVGILRRCACREQMSAHVASQLILMAWHQYYNNSIVVAALAAYETENRALPAGSAEMRVELKVKRGITKYRSSVSNRNENAPRR